ncbi:MAG: hypothetical protein WEF53_07385 [Bacteroidota bacterium]
MVPDSDAVYDRIRRYDGESAHHLLKFVKKQFGTEMLEKAWEEFHFSDGSPFNMEGPDGDPFSRWVMFSWKAEAGKTLAELYLEKESGRIDPALREFIVATVGSPYSFCQVLEVQPGEGLLFRDFLRNREVQVKERMASGILERGHIVLVRIVEMDGLCFMMGTHTQIILPGYLDMILGLRARLQEKDAAISNETLLRHEDDLRGMYFDIQRQMARPPEIRNTDGDPLAFHTLTYEIPSFEVAFDSLKDLQQRVTGESDEELLQEAKTGKKGIPTEVTLHLLRKGATRGLGDNTLLATLTIKRSRLVVEVNSERRSAKVQKEIKKRLGEEAVLLKTEIRSQEGVMRETEKPGRGPKELTENDRLIKESPEIAAMVKETMERHWSSWPDEPLPALRGMTPRQAMKDSEGRELLESLLMEFELHNHAEKDPFLRVDVEKLRKELGLVER